MGKLSSGKNMVITFYHLTSHNKAGLHQTLRNSVIDFLRTDLDGNLLPSNLDLTSHNKAGLHRTFPKFLMSSSAQIYMEIYLSPWILLPLPSWIMIYQHCLRDYQKLQTKTKCLINMCGMKKQALLHQWDSWHCVVCNTDSPIHIHKFISSEVWKAFNVGVNA